MLQINHLKKMYNKNEVLTDVNYIFNKGQLYPILGCNGSGRTTLFDCIAGDLKIDAGEVKIKDKSQIVVAAKQSILPMNLTGYEFIEFMAGKDADSYLDKVCINQDTRHKLIKEYDFVTKKRLQLAAFLVQKPYVVMFDEPFDYCEDAYIQEFVEILNSMKDDHVILISTGILETANKISEDVVVLNNGELNLVSKDSLSIPEIKKAVLDILGEDDNEDIM